MDAQTRPTSATPLVQARTQAVAAAAVVLLFGIFLVYGVGFAQPMTIHNAAHDTRHSFTFPCH
jgi:cobalt transporter subunit CbtB